MTTTDRFRDDRLHRDLTELCNFADDSDILEVRSLDAEHHLMVFHCCGLAGAPPRLRKVDRFAVVLTPGADYLRVVRPEEILTLLEPADAFHPNIRYPFVCIGPIEPGTRLLDIAYRTYEVLSFQNVGPREDDALNPAACAWTRANLDLLPTDTRPLRRRLRVDSATNIQSSSDASGSGSAEVQ